VAAFHMSLRNSKLGADQPQSSEPRAQGRGSLAAALAILPQRLRLGWRASTTFSALVTPDVTAYMNGADDGLSMLPSLFRSDEDARPWSVPRAALYGAGIGLLAALVRTLGPLRDAERALPFALEICIAVGAFALLCAGAALLRNLLVRQLPDRSRRK